MGFFSDLGGKAVNGIKEWSEEANEYYHEAMSMDDDELRAEARRVLRSSNMAKRTGYRKAAKERGLI